MPTMHQKEMKIDSWAKLLKRELSCPYLSLMMMMMMMIAHNKMILTGLRSFESVMPVMVDDKI